MRGWIVRPVARFDRAASCAAVYAAFALVYVSALLARTGFHPSRLVRAAAPWTNVHLSLRSLTVLPAAYGFNGQFFYRLAIAPFSSAAQVDGVTFDAPALRGSRIGMGLVAYVLSAGQPALVPVTLLLTNVLCFVVLGFVAGGLAQSFARHSLWGVVLMVWPGFAYSFALDTAEILAVTFLAGGLLALRRARLGWAIVGLVGAVITRESTVAVVVGLWLASVYLLRPGNRDRPDRRTTVITLAASTTAGVVFASVQLYGRMQFGGWPLLSSGQSNLGVPFSGIVGGITRSVPPTSDRQILDLTAIVLVVIVAVAALLGLARSPASMPEKVGWIAAALMLVAISGPWISAPSSMRASTEFALMAAVVLAGVQMNRAQRRIALIVLGYTVAVWVLTVGTMLVKVPPA